MQLQVEPFHDSAIKDDIRLLIGQHRIDEAHHKVIAILKDRTDAGDMELESVAMMLQHYYLLISKLPPLSHIGSVPLRSNDALYACFDEFIDLLRIQGGQINELNAMIAELL